MRGEVRGSRFESNFLICMELLESQRRSNIIRRERKVFPAPFSPYFVKKCCFNEVSLVSDVPIRSLILCNCGICEHVQTAIAASSIAVTTGILLPRSEQPVQMRQLYAGGISNLHLRISVWYSCNWYGGGGVTVKLLTSFCFNWKQIFRCLDQKQAFLTQITLSPMLRINAEGKN